MIWLVVASMFIFVTGMFIIVKDFDTYSKKMAHDN